MSHKFQFIVFIVLTILMVIISLTKNVWKKSKTKPGVKILTIYGYLLTGLATTIIVGLLLNIKRSKEVEKTWNLTQAFDDTLYSLSKQLLDHNLSYDRQTNQIKVRYIEGSGIEPYFQWQTTSDKSKSMLLIGRLSLMNVSSYTFYNIKSKMYFLKMIGDQFNRSQKSFDPLPTIKELSPNGFIGSYNFILSVNPPDNIFYVKLEYKSEDNFSINPIRQIYLIRDASGEPIQPKQIITIDSFDLVKAYLEKNKIW